MKCDCQLGLRGGAVCEDCKGTKFIQPKEQETIMKKVVRSLKRK